MSFYGNNSLLLGGRQQASDDIFWATAASGTVNLNTTFSGNGFINWGDGTISSISSGTSVSRTFNGRTNITYQMINGLNAITRITQTSPSGAKVGGAINVVRFSNLSLLVIAAFDVSSVIWDYTSNKFTSIGYSNNKVTGTIPSLSAHTELTNFQCRNNLLTGNIPNLNNNTKLNLLYCDFNQLTGNIPSLSANTALVNFACHNNQLTGSIPNLNNNIVLSAFSCNNNQLTGSIPNLSIASLRVFQCHSNQLSGSIPSLSTLPELTTFTCSSNQLTGNIPNLSNNNKLVNFNCSNNSITGFAGGTVSSTLDIFQAQNNQIPSSAVNAILAAFVAAGRTKAVNGGSCFFNLSGTGMGAPTEQGVADRDILVSRGWNVLTATITVPRQPTNVVGFSGDNKVSLTWTPPSNVGQSAIQDYTIQYSSDNGLTWTTFADGVSAATSATVTGLTNGVSYVFRVSATNSNGIGPYSAISAPVTPAGAIGAPSNLVATPTNSAISLSWTAPTGTVTDYVIQYSSNGGSSWTTFNDGVSTNTNTVVTGLINDTTYLLKVAAKNAFGTGLYSSTVSATPVASADGTPSQPNNLIANYGDSQVSLDWTPPTNEGESPITDYIIEYSSDNGASWVTFNDGVSIDTLGTVNGLTNGSIYLFRIAAVNSIGTGPFTAPVYGVPSAPTTGDYNIVWTTSYQGTLQGEPWVVSNNNLRARFNVEDSQNCSGLNPNVQLGTATAVINIGAEPITLSTVFSGSAELQDNTYETLDISLNNTIIARGKSQGGKLGCAMGPIEQTQVASPITLSPLSSHILKIDFTTADGLFHVGAFAQVDLSLSPAIIPED